MSAKAAAPRHQHSGRDPHAGVPGAPPLGGSRDTGTTPSTGATAGTSAGASTAASAASLAERLAPLGLAMDVPPEWKNGTGSSMRLATLILPRVAGDDRDGEMSISALGGSLESNIDRWQGQFAEKSPPERQDLTTPGGVTVSIVYFKGTFSPGMGTPGSMADTVLLGAIAKIPNAQQMLFIKSWGPSATMEHWKGAFESMVQSLKTL